MHNSFITTHAQLRITEIKYTLNYYFDRHQMSVEDGDIHQNYLIEGRSSL